MLVGKGVYLKKNIENIVKKDLRKLKMLLSNIEFLVFIIFFVVMWEFFWVVCKFEVELLI